VCRSFRNNFVLPVGLYWKVSTVSERSKKPFVLTIDFSFMTFKKIMPLIVLVLGLQSPGLFAADLISNGSNETVQSKQGLFDRSLHQYTIPDVLLINNKNEKIALIDALGGNGAILLDFVFTTCPSFCPIMSAIFKQVQNVTGKSAANVRFVSISIDPEHDTPERLDAYAKRFSAGSDWQFLTGSVTDILSVQKAFDAYRGDKMNHQQLIFVKPANELSWMKINGIVEVQEIINVMRLHP